MESVEVDSFTSKTTGGTALVIEESSPATQRTDYRWGGKNQQGRDYAGPEELSEGGNPSAIGTDPMPHIMDTVSFAAL